MNCKECIKQTEFGYRSRESISNCTCEISEAKCLEEFLVWAAEFDCFASYRPDTPNKKDVAEMVRSKALFERRDKGSKEYKSVIDFVKRILDALDSEVWSFLDVGSGSGLLTTILGDDIDVVPTFCDYEDRLRVSNDIQDFDLIKEDIIPFDSKNFSFATIFMFLHHAKDPVKLVREIYRVLEKGGYCFVQEYSCDSWRKVFSYDTFHDLVQEDSDRKHLPVTGYRTRDGWRKLFLDAGFKLVKFTPLNPVYHVYIDAFQKV